MLYYSKTLSIFVEYLINFRVGLFENILKGSLKNVLNVFQTVHIENVQNLYLTAPEIIQQYRLKNHETSRCEMTISFLKLITILSTLIAAPNFCFICSVSVTVFGDCKAINCNFNGNYQTVGRIFLLHISERYLCLGGCTSAASRPPLGSVSLINSIMEETRAAIYVRINNIFWNAEFNYFLGANAPLQNAMVR